MPSKLTPSAKTFVLRSCDVVSAEQLKRALPPDVRLEPVAGQPNCWLVELERDIAASAREAWQRLQEMLHPGISIIPALIDEQGNERFPTGTVLARFQRPPTDDEIAAHGQEFGIGAGTRNKYIATQVAFKVPSPVFLPDLVARMVKSLPDTVDVWPDTISQYRRQ